ncbi:hypothetical protein HSB1_15060 [Halogranum salarium B-1]|uniref:Uncharacterized protein n=1 Tax=Halogranum salarium B-1 TaxID=1210908 RepID=J3A5Z4_9EURY|nr:hypothetical protein HSB1_15060 [Halogranum salarium B-1]
MSRVNDWPRRQCVPQLRSNDGIIHQTLCPLQSVQRFRN